MYTIPEKINNLLTVDFLKEFRKELFKINKYDLSNFAEFSVLMNSGTSGWVTAFGVACINTNKLELYKYVKSLDWQDFDICVDDITGMLLDNKLILGELSKVIEQQLNIPEHDQYHCSMCYGVFTIDMVKLKDEDYICFRCENPNYYQESMEKLELIK